MKISILIAFIVASISVWAVPPEPAGPNFSLHEWGTFTSVSASDGALLPGLQNEEETLPWFVRSHGAGIKGFARPLANVTIKMETPVLYFYAKEPFAAQVKVGFRGGSISQWYPERSGGEKEPAAGFDFAKQRFDGSIEWDVKVMPTADDDAGRVFKDGETLNWIYPRQTDSALVAANGGIEKFLFYRGVGNFPLPMSFTASDEGAIRAQNRGSFAMPGGLIFEHRETGGVRFAPLPAIAAGEQASVSLSGNAVGGGWERAVYDSMAQQLVAAGLYRKEADAMMQTWWKSYFDRPGLRVFWLVPQQTTEGILPLKVTPSPREQVRVLVGRSELLTPAFERQLVRDFADPAKNPRLSDRFFAAYATRVRQLKAVAVR